MCQVDTAYTSQAHRNALQDDRWVALFHKVRLWTPQTLPLFVNATPRVTIEIVDKV